MLMMIILIMMIDDYNEQDDKNDRDDDDQGYLFLSTASINDIDAMSTCCILSSTPCLMT